MTLWDEVDERVLRWVASRPLSYADSWQLLELHDEAKLPDAPELEGLGWREIGALSAWRSQTPHTRR